MVSTAISRSISYRRKYVIDEEKVIIVFYGQEDVMQKLSTTPLSKIPSSMSNFLYEKFDQPASL